MIIQRTHGVDILVLSVQPKESQTPHPPSHLPTPPSWLIPLPQLIRLMSAPRLGPTALCCTAQGHHFRWKPWEIAIILCLIPYFILSAITGMVEAVKLMALGIFLLTLLIIGVWFCICILNHIKIIVLQYGSNFFCINYFSTYSIDNLRAVV